MNEASNDFFGKMDDRLAKGGWAPGNYTIICAKCGDRYMGYKRASECADCAYGDNERDHD